MPQNVPKCHLFEGFVVARGYLNNFGISWPVILAILGQCAKWTHSSS